ncbi:MAG: phosphonoacetaldehyde reductase [Planctomycetota bacterium]|jgi:alcohol dehydrogenase class IV|nr:phosphonoacetaldehyde reductase [Planctomycetota bacterium]
MPGSFRGCQPSAQGKNALGDKVGYGALGEALTVLEGLNYRKVLLVATPSAWKRFNARGQQPFFPGRECRFFADFNPNPSFPEIEAGCRVYREFKPDLLVAIGGGSPIDVAKSIKALAHTREDFPPERPEEIKASGEGPPLVAIATTAGSGSEATRFAVFYLGERKQSLAHPSLRPEMAVVDPEMTRELPPDITAATGFDALSQAVESHWSPHATPESREFSRQAIRSILPNIYNAVHTPDPQNRLAMANAAYLAGKAINLTRTGIPHALAYHLTKRYGLPHGQAVALTLPYFFAINSQPEARAVSDAMERERTAVMQEIFTLLGQDNPEDTAFFWRHLLASCGLAATLREAGLEKPEQVAELVASINPSRLGSNPVVVEPDLLRECFSS